MAHAFTEVTKTLPLEVADVNDIVSETLEERLNGKDKRTERIAIRISPETLRDIEELADVMGMRSATTQRILLPDVIKAAVSIAHATVV